MHLKACNIMFTHTMDAHFSLHTSEDLGDVFIVLGKIFIHKIALPDHQGTWCALH